MRTPRAIPLLLALIALALPAGAQIKTNAGADAAAGTSGQAGASLNSGGAAPIELSGASVSPLSLSPALGPSLSAPAVNLDQGLAPSALTAAPRTAPAAEVNPAPQAAAAPAPANAPPNSAAKISPASPAPKEPFAAVLRRLGVPDENLADLSPLVTPRAALLAETAASMSEAASETSAKRVLIILSAALRDAPALQADHLAAAVGARFGFDDKQVRALGRRESFDNPADFFPASDKAWAEAWVRRLSLAENAAGEAGRLRAKMTKAADAHAKALREHPDFALLPEAIKAELSAETDARSAPDSASPLTGSAAAAARAPPVSPDLASARRYIIGIMGRGRAPTEREADSLLGDWLDENGIPRGSPRAAAVRRALIPAKASADADVAAKLNPALRRHSALLIRLAEEHKTTAAYVESVIIKRGFLPYLSAIPDSQLENQIQMALAGAELERAVSKYPDNAQGELMRAVASAMATKGGKSVEEVARDGVFLYADFSGSSFLRGYASRDPDIQIHTIAFYVTRRDGKWRLDGYRQKVGGRMSDLEYINALKAWLRAGGLPSSDFF